MASSGRNSLQVALQEAWRKQWWLPWSESRSFSRQALPLLIMLETVLYELRRTLVATCPLPCKLQSCLLMQTGSMRGRGIGETLLQILQQEGITGLFRYSSFACTLLLAHASYSTLFLMKQ